MKLNLTFNPVGKWNRLAHVYMNIFKCFHYNGRTTQQPGVIESEGGIVFRNRDGFNALFQKLGRCVEFKNIIPPSGTLKYNNEHKRHSVMKL